MYHHQLPPIWQNAEYLHEEQCMYKQINQFIRKSHFYFCSRYKSLVRACKKCHYFYYFSWNLFWVLHQAGCEKQNLRLFQVSPVSSWEMRCLKILVGYQSISWEPLVTLASSTQASIHLFVYCPTWSLATSLCTSLMHSPCPHYQVSVVSCLSQLLLPPLSGWETLLYHSCLGQGLRIVSGLVVQIRPAT